MGFPMQRAYESNNRKMSLHITVVCNGTKKFRVWAEELGKKDSKYADRVISVTNSRTIHFNFPVSPNTLFIGCLNAQNSSDKDFEVTIKEEPLKTYNIVMDSDTREFVQMAINVSQTIGFAPPPQSGTLYQTSDGKFNIKNFPAITDRTTGEVIGTPARIGHSTGLIEIAYQRFRQYTVPMRLCILLHEYSHKYRNPKIGLKINNEFGADINGLYIYLGIGFSKVDAICVFAEVFLKAQTDGNIQRMRKIQDYIQRFENQEYAQRM
jgi:hypothetical protein